MRDRKGMKERILKVSSQGTGNRNGMKGKIRSIFSKNLESNTTLERGRVRAIS